MIIIITTFFVDLLNGAPISQILFFYHQYFIINCDQSVDNNKYNKKKEKKMDDVCPICKTSRYLNPDMKFKVSTECYHKMCESCVDRIFALGPAPCPFASCGRTLRRNKFTDQRFEDIGVEKEVNIRAKVKKTYNRGEEHFKNLEEYNNYLEEIEDVVFNLRNNIDVEETERKLQEYERKHKEEIRAIDQHRVEESRKQAALFKIQEERRQQKREFERQQEEAEKELEEQERKNVLRQLATSEGNAKEIMEQSRKEAEKRRKEKRRELRAKQKALEKQQEKYSQPGGGAISVAQRAIGANGTPFTPFNGDRQPNYLFQVSDNYFDPLTSGLEQDKHYKASGFKIKDAYEYALVHAFFGLGCDIQSEKSSGGGSEQPEQVNQAEVNS